MESYKTLEKVFRKLSDINQAKSVLHWDMAVTMPQAGAKSRSYQLATLTTIYHSILKDEAVGELITRAGSETTKLDQWQKANLELMANMYKHAASVPAKILNELTIEGVNCEFVWREARAANDFSKLKPSLEKVVRLVRKIAKIKGDALGVQPYDALLDQYDRGRKMEQLDVVFEDLKGFLPEFLTKVLAKQESEKVIKPIKGPFAIDLQKQLANKMLNIIGFDFKSGRLDESHHPFCGGYPSDVRITTRYDENNFLTAIMGIQHEAGHAMYESGLPTRWSSLPVGEACGMSIHESQSLLMEMQVCRSREFTSFAAPIYREIFASNDEALAEDNLYNIVTKVQPSLIRVDADEVTYPLHIIMRYYIEKYLINGDMEVADLPDAWAQGMEKLFGIAPDSDKNGCMQDIHWMDGTFGYFPTYSLGAIYAAQIFKSAKAANPDLMQQIAAGDMVALRQWLNNNIHQKGSLYKADDLVKEATGSGIDVAAYKEYLTQKYTS